MRPLSKSELCMGLLFSAVALCGLGMGSGVEVIFLLGLLLAVFAFAVFVGA